MICFSATYHNVMRCSVRTNVQRGAKNCPISAVLNEIDPLIEKFLKRHPHIHVSTFLLCHLPSFVQIDPVSQEIYTKMSFKIVKILSIVIITIIIIIQLVELAMIEDTKALPHWCYYITCLPLLVHAIETTYLMQS